MQPKFYICAHCGNIVELVKDQGVSVMCCGQKMVALIPGTTDAAVEKHVPVYQVENNQVSVTVGAVEHPMTEAHFIEWIAVQTTQGIHRKMLRPDEKPQACFALCEGETVEAVYAYCNLHGLWKG